MKRNFDGFAGFRLIEASSKFAIWKSNLPLVKNVGSKWLLSRNSLMKVISWKNKQSFTELILLYIRQNTISYGQGIIKTFDHTEFCLVIHLTMYGNQAVT